MTARAGAWTALLLAAAILAAQQSLFFGHTVDDAYINFRFAENLARGHGFAYNPGGAPVMGFVDTLWIALLAGCDRAGLDVALAAKAIGAAFAFGTLFLGVLLSRRIGGAAGNSFPLVPLFSAAAGPFALWSVSGMETGLYSFLLVAAFLSLDREWRSPRDGLLAGALFAAAVLARPEALGLGLVAFAARRLFGEGRRGGGKLGFALGLGLPVLAYAVWIRATFGDPLPNVFYAKGVPGDPRLWRIGAGYVHSFLGEYGGIALLVLVPAIGMLRPGPGRAGALAAAAAIAAETLYAVGIGGDWMEGHRFFTPLLPLWFALVERGLRAVVEGLRASAWRVPAAVPAAGAAILVAATALPTRRLPLAPETGHAHERVIEWFRKNAPAGSRVALWDVGAIPYLTGLEGIDFAGLTDRRLTREFRMRPFSPFPYERADGEAVVRHVLDQDPDFVVLKMDGDRPVRTELADLFFESPEFLGRYRREGTGESRYGVFRRTERRR